MSIKTIEVLVALKRLEMTLTDKSGESWLADLLAYIVPFVKPGKTVSEEQIVLLLTLLREVPNSLDGSGARHMEKDVGDQPLLAMQIITFINTL